MVSSAGRLPKTQIITNIMIEKAYSSRSPPMTSSSPAPPAEQNPHKMQAVLNSSSQHKHRFSQVASVQNRQTVRSQTKAESLGLKAAAPRPALTLVAN